MSSPSLYRNLLLLLSALSLFLTVSVGVDAAGQRSCRRCDCEITIGPYVGGVISGKDAQGRPGYMDAWSEIYTGGDYYWWNAPLPVESNNYTSNIHFPVSGAAGAGDLRFGLLGDGRSADAVFSPAAPVR